MTIDVYTLVFIKNYNYYVDFRVKNPTV